MQDHLRYDYIWWERRGEI